jgi:hypothetical protein
VVWATVDALLEAEVGEAVEARRTFCGVGEEDLTVFWLPFDWARVVAALSVDVKEAKAGLCLGALGFCCGAGCGAGWKGVGSSFLASFSLEAKEAKEAKADLSSGALDLGGGAGWKACWSRCWTAFSVFAPGAGAGWKDSWVWCLGGGGGAA